MNDNVSFHLIISFNFNWSGFKYIYNYIDTILSVIDRELTHQYCAINAITTFNRCQP